MFIIFIFLHFCAILLMNIHQKSDLPTYLLFYYIYMTDRLETVNVQINVFLGIKKKEYFLFSKNSNKIKCKLLHPYQK